PDRLLREVWRILAPEGRAMFIVPNRGGIWARADGTPFGHGRPYTRGQLERLLSQAMLSTVGCIWALHLPPVERPLVLKSAVAIERFGARIWPSSAGVMLLEARKELTAPTGLAVAAPAIGDLVRIPNLRPAARRDPAGSKAANTTLSNGGDDS
ncbi:MAG: hypothetical protein AAGF51_16870, partial [Pseudomonadota bacterium]